MATKEKMSHNDKQVASYRGWERYLHKKKNQVWQMLPMREKNEDWQKQLSTVIVELRGLERLKLVHDQAMIIEALAKLGGLYDEEEFMVYRKTIFEVITLLEELSSDE